MRKRGKMRRVVNTITKETVSRATGLTYGVQYDVLECGHEIRLTQILLDNSGPWRQRRLCTKCRLTDLG